MDVGRFIRTRPVLLAWLLLPPLLAAGIHFTGKVYGRTVSIQRSGLATCDALLPELEATCESASKVLAQYRLSGEAGEEVGGVDNLGALFQEAGATCGLRVDSIVIDRGDGEASTPVGIAVAGHGPLESLIRFLDRFQEDRRLFVASSVALRITELGSDPAYACTLEFQLRPVTTGDCGP